MRQFVRVQTAILLRDLAVQAAGAARAGEAGSIHDLRVAIRRLSRCLRTFARFYPGNSWKVLRRRLRRLMDACGGVRDRDIARELLMAAKVAATSPLVRRLDQERRRAVRELRRELRSWKDAGFQRRWRGRLEL